MILLFFMPAVFVWLTTMVIPFLYGIFISFLQWDGIGNNYEFIGLENYIKISSPPPDSWKRSAVLLSIPSARWCSATSWASRWACC